MYYYFILGQNKNLSIAELLNRPEIKKLQLNKKNIFLIENVLFLETDFDLDVQALINFIGGTIKIGQVRKKFKDFSEIREKDIVNLIKNREGKIPFGFSLVNVKNKKFIKKLAIGVKKNFRNEKINSRWIEAKGTELSSVAVKKNNLIDKGAEIYFFKSDKFVFMGKTLAVQDFESYSKRDYGRPGRDVFSGMVPPKLAQIMINLSAVRPQEIFLDPFCGSGTFLQEAILMGSKNIMGADISKRAIDDSHQNLEWLKENYSLKKYKLKLWQKDIHKISEVIKLESVDKIVTEPYLGPTTKVESRKLKVKSLLKELSKLYLEAFGEFKKILKKNGKIVIIIPALSFGKKLFYLDILDDIRKLRFEMVDFVPNDFKDLINVGRRGSIIYSRATPNQRIVREIFIFKKK